MSSFAPPSVLPDISPTSGEIGCHPGFRQPATLQGSRRRSGRPISPKWGRISGRTEGGALERCRNRRHTDHPYELG
ncbi:MAG: hypothetical protein EOQ42_01355 [Mesorhizobium sp.]|nr:MAG: hypothetical protein EOQ43_16235 [Mesorhizobium sp.]RWB82338.1 MAG: hypothetical protein EOQ42_01355 [Mesorhizobium sp.]RWC96442.1 MAG: hypothetical protein EOS57_30375 [Mesorhizobium sp.]TGT99544.1 hypothetical protein EN807_06475 [Mesorhizobium sp. M5C.F.Ca.ET.164.01.1.1]TIU77711.1 MAG: hypothetical protein E5W13_13915 [Mesorhizobium sp.]